MIDFKLGDVGEIFKDIREAITGEGIKDPTEKLKLLKALQEAESKMMEQKAKTIVAEANSESWLASSWRPITMLVFVAIIANNYIFVPYMRLFGYEVPILEIPPYMWDVIEMGLSGYIVGRSVEKAVRIWKGE